MNEETTNASQTLGQRIQEGRKAAGLSQEALGEKLEVSRQAVSKWESDAAVPELEKLIAMSRLFGVSVGELLGVETQESAPDGVLTEKELAAAEAIAEKYAAAGKPARWGWKKVVVCVCAGAAAVALAAVVIVLSVQMVTLERNYRELKSQVGSIQESVSGQIGSITTQIQSALDEQNNLLADSSAEIADFDPDAKTVRLDVSALPKELPEGTAATFTATLSNGRKLTAEAESDGGHFTVTDWEVPMDDEIQVTALFTGNGTAYSAVVSTLSADEETFEFRAYGLWSSSWRSGRSSTVSLGGLDLNIYTEDYIWGSALKKPLAPLAVDVCLFRNLETKPEKTFPVEDAASLWDGAGMLDMSAMTGYETTVNLSDGDTVIAAVRIRDNYGRTTYFPLDAWRSAEGDIQTPLLPTKNYSDGSQLPGPWIPGTALD